MKRTLIIILVFILGIMLGIIFMKIYYDKDSSKTGIVQQEETSSTPTPVPTDTPTPTPTPTFTPTPTPDLSVELQPNNTTERLKELLSSTYWSVGQGASAGQTENYTFNSDGTFEYKTSEYDGEKRLLSFSGKWDIVGKNLLHLIITNKTVLEGGRFEKEINGGATDYVITDAEVKEIELCTPEEIIYPLRDLIINIDERTRFPVSMEFGGKHFTLFYYYAEDINEIMRELAEEDF